MICRHFSFHCWSIAFALAVVLLVCTGIEDLTDIDTVGHNGNQLFQPETATEILYTNASAGAAQYRLRYALLTRMDDKVACDDSSHGVEEGCGSRLIEEQSELVNQFYALLNSCVVSRNCVTEDLARLPSVNASL